MLIQVHSTISGPHSGWLCFNFESSDKVSDILEEFARQKNIQRSSSLNIYRANGLALDIDDTLEAAGLTDGSNVYVGLAENQRSMFTFEKRWWPFLAALALLVGCGGLVWAPVTFFEKLPVPFDYGVVIDAGSSGSRVSLYEWVGNKDNGTGVVVQLDTCKMEPGLTNQNATMAAVDAYLSNCVSAISEEVPKKERFTAPIYLGATAGMRLLRQVNPERSDLLMEATRMSLGRTQLQLRSSEIITGHQEGTSGWITVNFLKGILHDKAPDGARSRLTVSHELSYGAMDLGGASTQVTFEIDEDTVVEDPRDSSHLKLYGRPFRIFSRSYLCYGVNEAYRRYLALVFSSADRSEKIIPDPCGNIGRTRSHLLSYVFGSPCSSGLVPPGLVIGEADTMTLTGAWDRDNCHKMINRLLDPGDCSKYSSLCFNSSFVPARVEKTPFVAFSVFYYLYAAMGLAPASSDEQFRDAAFRICNMSAVEMNETMWKAVFKREDVAAMLCFEGIFVEKMLIDEYKMQGEEFRRIEFLNKIPDEKDGANIGWSLGYMINATNALPEEIPSRPMSMLLFSFLVFVFVGLASCGAFLAVHAWILARRRRIYNDYQRLNNGESTSDYLKL